jgi:hypothetical protein
MNALPDEEAVNKKRKYIKKNTDHFIKWTFSNLIEREWGCNQEYI